MDAHMSQPRLGVGIESLLPECSSSAMHLLKRMLIFDNQARISAAQAFQHSFVQPGHKATIDDIAGHRSAVLTARAISRINLDLPPEFKKSFEFSREEQMGSIVRVLQQQYVSCTRAIEAQRALYAAPVATAAGIQCGRSSSAKSPPPPLGAL